MNSYELLYIINNDLSDEQKAAVVDKLNAVVADNGGTVDIKGLSKALGVPVVPIVAAKGEGVSELIDQAVGMAKNGGLRFLQ